MMTRHLAEAPEGPDRVLVIVEYGDVHVITSCDRT
jgi:hypothetical protein